MFDDGYDNFCLNIVSMFERDPSGKKHDISTYCGCIDYLEGPKEDLVADETAEVLPETA